MKVATITGIDEYGPRLEWTKHWAELGAGTVLCSAPQAQPEGAGAVCGVCFEEEAFTGTCGGGRANPKALCFQGTPPAPSEPVQPLPVVGEAVPPPPLTERELRLLERMISREMGHAGQCGFGSSEHYAEQHAVDLERVAILRKLYTPPPQPESTELAIIRSFMQRHTQSNVDRMSLEDLHAAVEPATSQPVPAGDVGRVFIAARAVVSHWCEFGPEHGFDEAVDNLHRAFLAIATHPQPAQASTQVPVAIGFMDRHGSLCKGCPPFGEPDGWVPVYTLLASPVTPEGAA